MPVRVWAIKTLVVTTAIVLSLSLGGCSPTPEAIVDEACTAMSQAHPYSTTISYIAGPGAAETTVCHTRDYGPNQKHLDWQIEPEAQIVIAHDFWDSWHSHTANPVGIATSLNPGDLRSLNPLIDWETLPDEPVDGINCLHFRGQLDLNAFVEEKEAWLEEYALPYERELLLATLQEIRRWEITVEVWVGETDKLIRQMRWHEEFPLEPTNGEETWTTQSTTTKFYDFS